MLLMVIIPGAAIMAQVDRADLEMVYKIKQEGLKNSDMDELAFWMTDFLGPRLTASEGKQKADRWAEEKMKEYGLLNVKTEGVRPFDRGGWDNVKAYAAMTAPYYTNFAITPKAWTGSTNGLVKGVPVLVDVQSEADFEKYRGQLQGKIVILPATSTYEVSFEPFASRYSDEELEQIQMARTGGRNRYGNFNIDDYRRRMMLQRQISEFLKDQGVAVLVNGSGEFNVPRSSGGNYTAGDKEPVAEVNLPVEAHGRIVRLLQHQVAVEMEIEVKNRFYESKQVTNVMGEIPGTDPKLKNEVVLIGGHLDSWHAGTGAADNASGCMVMMEAMRILKALDVQPKRTIRIALWGGEEQGLHGSRGYVEKYIQDPETKKMKDGYRNFAAYFNMDNGTGKFRGIYTQENEMVVPIFEEWLKPFTDMGCSTVTKRTTGGTDHLAFDPLGLPAFQFIQDEIEYSRGYHTNMDTYERLVIADLRHNAVVVAAMVYQEVKHNKKLPSKPEIESHKANNNRRF